MLACTTPLWRAIVTFSVIITCYEAVFWNDACPMLLCIYCTCVYVYSMYMYLEYMFGPVVFNIYINGFTNVCHSSFTELAMYADVTCMLQTTLFVPMSNFHCLKNALTKSALLPWSSVVVNVSVQCRIISQGKKSNVLTTPTLPRSH